MLTHRRNIDDLNKLTENQSKLEHLMAYDDESTYGGKGEIDIPNFLELYKTDDAARDAYNKYKNGGGIPLSIMKQVSESANTELRRKKTTSKPKRKPVKCSCKKK